MRSGGQRISVPCQGLLPPQTASIVTNRQDHQQVTTLEKGKQREKVDQG